MLYFPLEKAVRVFVVCFLNVVCLFAHQAVYGAESGQYLGRGYHMTASTSPNLSEIQIINTSDSPLTFTGTLYHKSGDQLGESNIALHEGVIAPQGRLVLASSELENRFNVMPWTGPAILDVTASGQFELMGKLYRNGRVTNSNCVRTGNVHNVEGTDSVDVSYVRFINVGSTPISYITGTLYDVDGNIIGQRDTRLFEQLAAREAIFLNRPQLSNAVQSTWTGEASVVLEDPHPNLRLMNLNFVNSETFFNFSCYESGAEFVETETYPTELSGLWTGQGITVKLIFLPNGRYFAVRWEDEGGQDGIEAGSYQTVGNTLVVVADVNDDGDGITCGGDENNQCSTNNTWAVSGDVLTFNGEALLDRENLPGTGLAGVWEKPEDNAVFIFEEDLTYTLIQYVEGNGYVGYERGTYTQGATTLTLTQIENNDGQALACDSDEGEVCDPSDVDYSLSGDTLTLFGDFVFQRSL